MKKLVLLTLMAINFQISSFACSCIPPTSFCESITDEHGNVHDGINIIRGKVIDDAPSGKTIRVDQLIRGDLNKTELTLRNGFCTLFFSDLKEDLEYLIAIGNENTSGDFFLVACAISFLEIENEVIKGKIAPGLSRLDYQDLSDLEGCGNAFDQIAFDKNLEVFPNPTLDDVKIRNTSTRSSFEDIKLRVLDASGKELIYFRKADALMPKETWKIDIQQFASGLYIFELQGKYQFKHIKIVKI